MKSALITGASRGIGYELAREVAKDGYNIVLVSRTKEDLQEVKRELEDDFSVKGKVITGDLSNPETPKYIIEELTDTKFRIDLLINNAGRGQMGEFLLTNEDVDRELMQLNVNSVVTLTKPFLSRMVNRGHGGIINVSSLAAFQPGPLSALYYASKAFVQSFSEALAEEVANKGITVTALAPGPVDTGFEVKGAKPSGESDRGYALEPKEVAQSGYEGFKRGKRIVVPGKLLSTAPQLVRFLPRRFVTWFLRKMHRRRLNK